MKKFKQGFTLVEMLVVVAVIGVLAVVLFVAINPIEQLNKTRDAGKIGTAREIMDAAERYYVTFDQNPPATCLAGVVTDNELETTGELKDEDYSFFTLNCSDPALGSFTVDFEPDSNSYQENCDPDGSEREEGNAVCTIPTDLED